MIFKHTLAKSQSGVVLIVSLIVLLILTLISISGMQTTGIEEKMAGNLRDKSLAFQAAESALRDAEKYINTVNDTTPNKWIALENSSNTTCATDGTGFCPLANPTLNNTFTDSNWVTYGRLATSVDASLSQQPRYTIEIIRRVGTEDTSKDLVTFRLTTRAWGRNNKTIVQLQTKHALLSQASI